jgi:hypothetical protein
MPLPTSWSKNKPGKRQLTLLPTSTGFLLELTSVPDEGVQFGSQFLTAVTMKTIVFWEVTPCILVAVYKLFGGNFCFYLQGTGHGKQ